MNNEQKAQSLPSASLVQNGVLGDVDMEVLTLLCSDDDLRKWMTKPFSVGNQTCATNGWSLLVVDKKSDYPDMSEKTKSVYPVELSFTNKLEISKVKKAIDKIPLIDCYDKIVSKCDACYGNGNVDFEFEYSQKTYEMEGECPVCEGEGTTMQTSKTPNGKKELDYNKLFQIGLCAFNVERINELIFIAESIGVDEVVLVNQTLPHRPSVFLIGDVEFLAMSTLNSDLDAVAQNIA